MIYNMWGGFFVTKKTAAVVHEAVGKKDSYFSISYSQLVLDDATK